MKLTFIQFLTEARIAVPESTKKEAMHVVAATYYNYVVYAMEKQGIKQTQSFLKSLRKARREFGDIKIYDFESATDIQFSADIRFYARDLPDSYKKKLRLPRDGFIVRFTAGYYPDHSDKGGEFYAGGNGKPAMIFVNLTAVPGLDTDLGEDHSMEYAMDELEGIVDHELQHATQALILKKHHGKQFVEPKEDDDLDTYYQSDVEFQPQITTAVNDFRRALKIMKSNVELAPDQVKGILQSFLSGGNMPQGLLKWKPYFRNDFFRTLYAKDRRKWQKAVKDFHGLLSKKQLT